jgi:hypothetical protein
MSSPAMTALNKNALSLTNVLRIMVVIGSTSAVGWTAMVEAVLAMLCHVGRFDCVLEGYYVPNDRRGQIGLNL